MYFVVIMAFALVLSDNLPPPGLNLLADRPDWTLGVVAAQLVVTGLVAWGVRRRTGRWLDGTDAGHDRAAEAYSRGQLTLLFVMAGFMLATMVLTPWPVLVRSPRFANLDRIPLVGDLTLLAPFLGSLFLAWTIQFPVESRLRGESLRGPSDGMALRGPGPKASLGSFLFDKFRHQVLIVAAPMLLIVLAKHFTDMLKNSRGPQEGLGGRLLSIPWVPDAILGAISLLTLVLAPVMLCLIWDTHTLAAGPLRDRFEGICRRIGLRYRDILVWNTHGMTVNAAVMGFVAPLRYILVSDALLESMSDDEVEAVFGHEAGHVHHWHLPYFGLFAIGSMYLSGGVLLLLEYLGMRIDIATLQLLGLFVLLAVWLFGFGWLSRCFERQADLFGVRCVTSDVKSCITGCPVHGERPSAGLCISAANLFGRTLTKIANLNGIPKQAPSWRHGSIESRCRLIAEFAYDPAALARFDRKLTRLKALLLAVGVVGTTVMVYLYGSNLFETLRGSPFRR